MISIIFALKLAIILFNCQGPSPERDVISKIRAEINCSDKSKTIFFFASVGECGKCLTGATETIDSICNEMSSVPSCRIALVRVSRSIELKNFYKNYSWSHTAIADNGTYKQKLGLAANTRIAIFDENNRLVGILTNEDLNPTAYGLFRKFFINNDSMDYIKTNLIPQN